MLLATLSFVSSALALHAGTPGRPDDNHAQLARAVAAAGGIDALRAVRSYRLQTQQQQFNVGQEDWPGAPVPLLVDSYQTAVVDHTNNGLWLHDERFKIGGVGIPVVARVMAGNIAAAYLDPTALPPLPPGSKTPAGPPVARLPQDAVDALQQQYRYMIPDQLLIAAFDAPAEALRTIGVRSISRRSAVGIAATLPHDTLSFWIDRDTGRLLAVTCMRPAPAVGKLSPVETRYSYANWTRTGNATLPWTTSVTVDGMLSQLQTAVAAELNPAGIDTLFQLDAKYAVVTTSTSRPITKLREVAPGILRAEGFTHTPIAVVQGDSIILLEAPASPEFVRSMLDSLRVKFPHDRVTTFVTTHDHSDHIAGVPTAFDAGLTAIVPVEIADEVRRLGVADGAHPAHPRRIEVVTDSMVVGTGPSRFVLYHVPSGHVSALLMAYFPEPQLLFDIDLAAGSAEDRQSLYDFLMARHVAVKNLSRIHGGVLTWDNFVKTVPDTGYRTHPSS